MPPTSSPPSPNILLILTDQLSADALSCAGNQWVKTPAIDRLSERGVRFERAYCTHPLCSPARSSLFTGLMPHQSGVYDNSIPFTVGADCTGLGAHLRQAGYHCAYVGRGPAPDIHGFELLGENDCMDPVVTPLASRFLETSRTEPFLLAVSYHNPHNICEWARRQNLRDAAIEVPSDRRQWPPLPANFAVAPYEADAVRWYQQSHLHAHPEPDWSADDWREYLYAYYRLVEAVDAQIAELLAALERSGAAENTIIIFSSDHGNGCAAHRWNQKTVLFEECIRIPLIVVDPRHGRRGVVDRSHLVSLGLDFFTTACDYAGVAAPDECVGLSLRHPVCADTPTPWRDHLFVETTLHIDGVPNKPNHILARAVIGERYKYAVYPLGRNREQLIDLHRDPGEMINLAVLAHYEEELRRQRDLLAAWKKSTGDKCPVPGAGT